jgi:hypothetical protein
MAKYVARYNEVHDVPITRFESASFPYDAFYLAAYLTVACEQASPSAPCDAPALARALPRLMRGPRVDVGQAGLVSTFDALLRGESVDLDGTITTLDFDLETGDPKVELSVFCLREKLGGARSAGGEPSPPEKDGHLAPHESTRDAPCLTP